jgi:hypothetical protein
MNLVLLLVLMAEICIGFCAWLSPEALRSMAAFFLTRADVIEAARKEHDRRLQFWQNELGLNRRARPEAIEAFEPLQSIARR